jgi:ATP-dependent DNA helicase DinG
MAVDGSFAYVKGRLGVREADEILVPGEFDYASQALLYLPRRMPPPKSPGFAAAVAIEAIDILRRTRGRAFVLFTSYAVLRSVQRELEVAVPYPILVQGQAPRSTLLQMFRSTPERGALATSSFWQGVDVVGEALSCVIVDKLPFASPGDPVTAARIDTINAKGRRRLRRLPGAAGHPDAPTGAGPAHPATAPTAGCWRCWTRGSGPPATAGGFCRRCRRRR